MTFDEFGRLQLTVELSGRELIQIYNFLLHHEASFNDDQLRFLEKIRAQLYAAFSIEQLEQLAEKGWTY